jgi:hypothetical protein
MNNTFKTITLSLAALLIVTSATYAIGTLTPQGTAGDDTHYTLNDIYNKLLNFTDTYTEGSGTLIVPGTVSATFNTLSDIYALLEAEEADLIPENIAEGVEIFGVEGTLSAGISFPTEWSADNPDGSVDWFTAMDYCDTLTEDEHTDWRLPSYIELVNAYLTGVSGFADDYYWSSTEDPYITGLAYGVYMVDGDAFIGIKAFPDNLARCAR